MKTRITQRLINTLDAESKAYRVHDTQLPGFFIRVLPSGHMSYMVTWARNKAATLGRVGVLTLDQARTEAGRYLSDAHEHGEPLAVTQGRRSAAMPTLERFLTDTFEPWALVHHKDGANGCSAIRASFADLLHLRLDELNAKRIEKLRSDWLASGLKPSTVNRNVTRLRGLLSRAVEWGVLPEHPLAKLKQLRVDKRGRVRYLLPDEDQQLRSAMDSREEKIRADRDNGNEWRKARKKLLLPDLRECEYADHLKPMVLVAINTGLRRGELFNLRWADVDLVQKVLTVEGAGAKSGQTRHIPLNREALATLKAWKKQGRKTGYVFPGKGGQRLDNVNSAWAALLKDAGIEAFRWHDLRHTFASRLAMAGVPLNTIRELMGHSDIQMTLRYAHLAPDVKAQAVELI